MKGWRTIVVNAITAGVAWLNVKFVFIDLTGEEQAAVALTLMAVVNMGLRYVTTTALGKKN